MRKSTASKPSGLTHSSAAPLADLSKKLPRISVKVPLSLAVRLHPTPPAPEPEPVMEIAVPKQPEPWFDGRCWQGLPAGVTVQVIPTPRRREHRPAVDDEPTPEPAEPKPLKVVRRRGAEATVFETNARKVPEAILAGSAVPAIEWGDDAACGPRPPILGSRR